MPTALDNPSPRKAIDVDNPQDGSQKNRPVYDTTRDLAPDSFGESGRKSLGKRLEHFAIVHATSREVSNRGIHSNRAENFVELEPKVLSAKF